MAQSGRQEQADRISTKVTCTVTQIHPASIGDVIVSNSTAAAEVAVAALTGEEHSRNRIVFHVRCCTAFDLLFIVQAGVLAHNYTQ
eukprot:COSAG02_NODE_42772_length_381_cov_1.021277_1_plen_86_part_00